MDTATALVLATSVMALGAITFSALSLAFQRSHSRKSVRPFCNVNQRLTDNGVSVSIQNAGMGPMRIRKVVLLGSESDPIASGIPLEQAFPAQFNGETCMHHLDSYVLAPLFEVELFRFAFVATDDAEKTRTGNDLNGSFLGIEYSDLYDDVYGKIEALYATELR